VVRFPRARLVDQVTEHLRDLILSGELKPGRPLLQEDLAQRLGVSRTPLREAFRVLERDGLVKSSTRSNTIEVITFTSQDVRRMYELREVLDGLAARLVARRAVEEPDVLTRLSKSADAIAGAVRPFDTGRFLTAHVEFHSLILEAAHNPYLLQFLPTLRMSAQMLYRHLPSKPERMRASATEHVEILDAIRSGDARKAESLARRHIRSAITSWTDAAGDGIAPESA
jgi:GntR family transcriptional regulator of vanillate catabolism